MNEMNKQLRELYSSTMFLEFAKYATEYNEKAGRKIANPYLLSVPDRYAECKKRVMIVGQETLSWYGPYGRSVEDLMTKYHDFVNEGKCRRSPIWRQYEMWRKHAKKYGVELMANNIAKAGYTEGTGYNRKAYELLKPIFCEELEICAPQAIIFVTGPRYDDIVAETMHCKMTKALQGFSARQFAKLDTKTPAWRTYHPGYLNRHREKFAAVLAEIERIIKDLP